MPRTFRTEWETYIVERAPAPPFIPSSRPLAGVSFSDQLSLASFSLNLQHSLQTGVVVFLPPRICGSYTRFSSIPSRLSLLAALSTPCIMQDLMTPEDENLVGGLLCGLIGSSV